jgi:hypothetical protein
MPAGIQIFDAQGVLIVDITDNLPRFIGSVYTGTSPGSIAIPAFSGGRGFAYSTDTTDTYPGDAVNRPIFQVTTSGISWSWGSGPPAIRPTTILYGVY